MWRYIERGEEERQFPSERGLIVRGQNLWWVWPMRGQYQYYWPIRGQGLAALIVWSGPSITPTQHPEMGIFRNVREHWKLILSVQFVIPGITVHLLGSLHLGSGSKLINSKCFTNIFCKPRLFLFILPITLTCIGKKKSVTGAKTWAINMLMNSFSCLFLFIRGGCDGPWCCQAQVQVRWGSGRSD